MQTARGFISTRFGLTFPALDANGEAHFENAVLSYYRFPFRQTVTLNRWIATGQIKMVNQITFWMYSTLCCVVVLAAAQDTCSTQWFTLQFTTLSDQVVDATLDESLLDDRNGSFFREFLKFTLSLFLSPPTAKHLPMPLHAQLLNQKNKKC